MPTPLGWGTVLVSLALYAAGAWLGYPELAVLGPIGLLAVGTAVLWTMPQPKLRVGRQIAPLKVAAYITRPADLRSLTAPSRAIPPPMPIM